MNLNNKTLFTEMNLVFKHFVFFQNLKKRESKITIYFIISFEIDHIKIVLKKPVF
jgi:hypothetical protein